MEMKKLKKILGSKGLWALIMLVLLLLMRILFPSANIDDSYWNEKFLRGFNLAGYVSIGAGIVLTVKGVINKELKQTVKGAVFALLGAAMLFLCL